MADFYRQYRERKKFRSELLKGECSVCAEDVVFIDADYDKDEEAF